MIKDNQKVFNRLHLIMDAIIIAVSYALSYYVRFYIMKSGPQLGDLSTVEYFAALIILIPLYLFSVNVSASARQPS